MTTVAGLFPILRETSFQAQILIPMAASICFGLVAATVLVLVLIPVFYFMYARFIQAVYAPLMSSDTETILTDGSQDLLSLDRTFQKPGVENPVIENLGT